MTYNIRDWYWIVAGDQTQVFSSARAAFVPAADPVYVDWLAQGWQPTKIDSNESLWDVLAQGAPDLIPAGDALAQDRLKDYRISRMTLLELRLLFNHENRLRVLEAKPALTQQQFVSAIKTLL